MDPVVPGPGPGGERDGDGSARPGPPGLVGRRDRAAGPGDLQRHVRAAQRRGAGRVRGRRGVRLDAPARSPRPVGRGRRGRTRRAGHRREVPGPRPGRTDGRVLVAARVEGTLSPGRPSGGRGSGQACPDPGSPGGSPSRGDRTPGLFREGEAPAEPRLHAGSPGGSPSRGDRTPGLFREGEAPAEPPPRPGSPGGSPSRDRVGDGRIAAAELARAGGDLHGGDARRRRLVVSPGLRPHGQPGLPVLPRRIRRGRARRGAGPDQAADGRDALERAPVPDPDHASARSVRQLLAPVRPHLSAVPAGGPARAAAPPRGRTGLRWATCS